MKSFDKAERYARANMHIEACADTLTNPTVAKELGNYTDRLIQILEWLYVPNIRHDVYEAPYRFKHSSRIPLMVVAPGEVLRYRTENITTMHPEQERYLDMERVKFSDTSIADRETASLIDEINTDAQLAEGEIVEEEGIHTTRAYVTTIYGAIKAFRDSGEVYPILSQTRPVVVMNTQTEPRMGEVLLHENVHVIQGLTNCLEVLLTDDDEIQVELEPNHHTIRAIKAKNGGIVPQDIKYLEQREKLRMRANGDGEHAFNVTPKYKRLIRKYKHIKP
jgi:hypothetical protein